MEAASISGDLEAFKLAETTCGYTRGGLQLAYALALYNAYRYQHEPLVKHLRSRISLPACHIALNAIIMYDDPVMLGLHIHNDLLPRIVRSATPVFLERESPIPGRILTLAAGASPTQTSLACKLLDVVANRITPQFWVVFLEPTIEPRVLRHLCKCLRSSLRYDPLDFSQITQNMPKQRLLRDFYIYQSLAIATGDWRWTVDIAVPESLRAEYLAPDVEARGMLPQVQEWLFLVVAVSDGLLEVKKSPPPRRFWIWQPDPANNVRLFAITCALPLELQTLIAWFAHGVAKGCEAPLAASPLGPAISAETMLELLSQ